MVDAQHDSGPDLSIQPAKRLFLTSEPVSTGSAEGCLGRLDLGLTALDLVADGRALEATVFEQHPDDERQHDKADAMIGSAQSFGGWMPAKMMMPMAMIDSTHDDAEQRRRPCSRVPGAGNFDVP